MAVAVLLLGFPAASVRHGTTGRAGVQLSRRASVLGLFALPAAVLASKDCFEDCNENCARNAPSSLAYCKKTCADFCAQPGVNEAVEEDDYSSPGEKFLSFLTRSALQFGGQVQPPGPRRQDAAARLLPGVPVPRAQF